MNKQERKELRQEMQHLSDISEEIYQLSSLLTKFCEANSESEDLYEVSLVTKIICEKSTMLALDMYHVAHKDIKPLSAEIFEGKIIKFVK